MTRFSIDRTFETIARTVVRFRWAVLVAWLLGGRPGEPAEVHP